MEPNTAARQQVPIICQGISGRRPSTKKQLAIFGIWTPDQIAC